MGCRDAITIKASTPFTTTTSLCTPHTTPDLHLPLQKNPRFFALLQFASNSSIVSCTFGALWGAGIPLFKYIWWNWMWMSVGTFVCVFVVCYEQHVFLFILQRPVWDMVDASQVPLSQNPAGLRPLWFSTLFSPCSPLSLFRSHYLFHSRLILSSLDLLDTAVAFKVVLEKRRIIGNKVNTLVGA